MDSIRAYAIVKVIASCGIEQAQALYGRGLCNQARFTLRASIARRQATHARAQGADLKARARFLAACNHGADAGITQRMRVCERDSKRRYRAALKYDRTARHAEAIAWTHSPTGAHYKAQALAQGSPLPGTRTHRLDHFPLA